MKKINYIFIVCFFGTFFSACSDFTLPFSEENSQFTLNISVPNSYQSNLSFYKYVDTSGTIQTKSLNLEKTNISITLSKNKVTPILFYSSSIDTQPNGCLYPVSYSASLRGGFTALIALCLYNQSYGTTTEIENLIAHFNWFKFYEALQEKTEAEIDDLWTLNQQDIINDIADGTFNYYSIN